MRILSVLSLVLSPSISFSYILSRSLVIYQYNNCYRYYHSSYSNSILSNCISNSISISNRNSYRFYSNNNNNDANDYHKKKKVHLLPRVYIPSSLVLNNYNDLDSDTSHYLGTVLRLKHGDMIRVFNPNNGEYLCEIIDIDKDKKRRKSSSLLRILIKEQLKLPVLSPSLVSVPLLYMAPIKKQRMKILLEKVTELGIDDIIPVVTQNTEKASIINSNNDDSGNGQYERILIESSEQCERLSIPTLHQTLELEDLLKSSDDDTILLVCRERYQGGVPLLSFLNQLSSSKSSFKTLGLLVGPEGGFTQEEFETMSKCKSVKFVSLGDNVLRAETAAINAISVINAYNLSK